MPEALGFFTRVGIGLETARRVTERAGGALEASERADVERLEREDEGPPPGPAVQQVSADGAMVPLTHGEWAEVKTVAVGTIQESAPAPDNMEPHATALSYFSRLAEWHEFCRLAGGELHRRGIERAGTVCAVTDGAEWLQSFMDCHRPDAVRILDFPHAAEHLAAAAHATYGPGTPEASEWLGRHLHELKHGDAGRVLDALWALPVPTASDPAGARVTLGGGAECHAPTARGRAVCGRTARTVL